MKPFAVSALLILTGPFVSASIKHHPFQNLPSWDHAYKAVNKICQLETVEGYEKGMFPEGTSITRYQMAQIIEDLMQNLSTRAVLNSPESLHLLQQQIKNFRAELSLQGADQGVMAKLEKIPLNPKSSLTEVVAQTPIVSTDNEETSRQTPGVRSYDLTQPKIEKEKAPAGFVLRKDTENPIEFSGELRLRPSLRSVSRPPGNSGPETHDVLEYRARLGMEQKLDGVEWFMTLQQSGDFGEQNLNPTGFTQLTAPGSGLELLHLGARFELNSRQNLVVGRQSLRISKPFVWDSQFDQRSRTFDAIVLEDRLSKNFGNLFLVSRLAEDDITQTFALNNGPDQDGYLFGASFFRPAFDGKAQLFWLLRDTENPGMVAGLKEELGSYGIAWDGKIKDLSLHLTLARQYGDQVQSGISQFQFDGDMQEIKLSHKFANDWSAHTEFVRFSGEKSGILDGRQNAFQKMYGSGHSYVGKTDLIDTSNVKSFGFGVQKHIKENQSLSIVNHWISLDSASQPVVLRREMPAYIRNTLVHSPLNQETDLGQELDVTWTFRRSENLVFALTHAWFRSGDYFSQNGVSDFDARYTYLSTEISF
ncbi:MAG: alginate export family protein [Candidatus Cloacimonetes bacterium]|nr:alginate export family protein [Candidatus Cloacimonadota bacterium]